MRMPHHHAIEGYGREGKPPRDEVRVVQGGAVVLPEGRDVSARVREERQSEKETGVVDWLDYVLLTDRLVGWLVGWLVDWLMKWLSESALEHQIPGFEDLANNC